MKKTLLGFLSLGASLVVCAQSTTLVISEVYGGAGCSTAGCSTYQNDYIEIFNRGTTPVNVNGWSVQYASATGTSTWLVTPLTNFTIQPRQYYLVAESNSANGISPLPTPDATGTIAMSATAGKVALVNSTTALSGACPSSATIVDLVGYGSTANCFEGAGPAPAPSTTTADVRLANGYTETNNNSVDFTATAPNPQNSSTTLLPLSLSEFNGNFNKSNGVRLTWKTVSEQNTSYFEVQRSADGGNTWFTVGKVNAAGNSNEERNYQLTDATPLKGNNLYRLLQVDQSKAQKFSAIIAIAVDKGGANYNLYPNPAKGSVVIRSANANSDNVQVSIVDFNGRMVKEISTVISLNAPYKLSVAGLLPGQYFVRIKNDNNIQTEKLLVQ